jgi:Fe-S cluster biogenesis protein NfuA
MRSAGCRSDSVQTIIFFLATGSIVTFSPLCYKNEIESDFCGLLRAVRFIGYSIFQESRRMRDKVKAALDKIRPALQRDGGDVTLVDVTEDGIVRVQLTGACKGCPMSQMTLKNGIERFVKSEVPEVKSVESV